MVVVKLQGGLGNQMFQYAAARGLATEDEVVYFDHSFLEQHNTTTTTFTARNYALNVFKNLKADKANEKQVDLFKGTSLQNKIKRRFKKPSYIQQKENELIILPTASEKQDIYLDGYFQSEKYFKHIRQELLNEFIFPDADTINICIKKKILNSQNPVSIHVRRGDYLNPVINKVHGILPLSYYYKCMDALMCEYNQPSIFVFSDDIQWVKQNVHINTSDVTYVDVNTSSNSWKDMSLISCCKHHVVANSSFSWWGAWLAEGKGKTFAPAKWFQSTAFNVHDFIPENWTVVEHE